MKKLLTATILGTLITGAAIAYDWFNKKRIATIDSWEYLAKMTAQNLVDNHGCEPSSLEDVDKWMHEAYNDGVSFDAIDFQDLGMFANLLRSKLIRRITSE